MHVDEAGARPGAVQHIKLLLTVDEACAALSIKRTLLYDFLATGELLGLVVDAAGVGTTFGELIAGAPPPL